MSTTQTTLWEYHAPNHLPEAQRRDYRAVVEGDYTIREWADEINRGAGTVGQNVARAKEKLGGRE